jgi:hypothetical protein
MNRIRDGSWWALGIAVAFLTLAVWRPWRRLPKGGAEAGIPVVAIHGQHAGSASATPRAVHLRPTTMQGPLGGRAYSTGIVETIRVTGDPSGTRLLGLIETNLPPGWEDTFVLHDALVTAGALTDLARVISFASSENLEATPRRALRGEALRFQNIADDVARRWFSSKYPMLGTNVVEQILREPSREMLPLLGLYNRIPDDDAVRLLDIPVRRAGKPLGKP